MPSILQPKPPLEVEIALDRPRGNLIGTAVQHLDARAAQLLEQQRSLVHQLGGDSHARMRYAGHPVVKELEQLIGRAHSILYQAARGRSRNWTEFWLKTWPLRMRQAARPILVATGIFWASAVVGFFLTAQNPVLESLFVSPPMRAAIKAKRLSTSSLTRIAPAAGSQIAANNIQVSLLTWGLGLTFGIGTVWFLVLNGIMLGAIAAACMRAGVLPLLAEFVIAHGSLELPAIWISAGAGLLMAEAMLFPGRFSRGVELRQKGRISVQIMVGIVPMLLVAAVIEAFVSPSNLPGAAKALLGASLALALLGFVISRQPGPRRGDRSRPRTAPPGLSADGVRAAPSAG
jgi:uncharacterized membrane protein SpoIIM required for sporulation